MPSANPTQLFVAQSAIPNLNIEESLGSLGLIAGMFVIGLSWASLSSVVASLFAWLTIGGNLLKVGRLRMFDPRANHPISIGAHHLNKMEKVIVWLSTLVLPPLALLFISLWSKKSYYKARQANLIALVAFVPWLGAVIGTQFLLHH